MNPKIIFEDDDILVLDKPAGWIVNDASTTCKQPTVQNWLVMNFDFPLFENREFRSGIVHRIDKETSGILLVAKNKKAYEDLQEQFKTRKVQKIYTALVHGKVEPGEGKIEVPLGRLPWRRERFGILPGGRESSTEYKVLNFFSKDRDGFSLLEISPKTGRTHQIRVHFKYFGHPIVADEFYAGRKTSRKDRLWCPRLFLHATRILFQHPLTKKQVILKSYLPQDLQKSLKSLNKKYPLSQSSLHKPESYLDLKSETTCPKTKKIN